MYIGGLCVRAPEDVGDGRRRETDDGTGKRAEENAECDRCSCGTSQSPENKDEKRAHNLCSNVHVERADLVSNACKSQTTECRSSVHNHEHEVCLHGSFGRCARTDGRLPATTGTKTIHGSPLAGVSHCQKIYEPLYVPPRD